MGLMALVIFLGPGRECATSGGGGIKRETGDEIERWGGEWGVEDIGGRSVTAAAKAKNEAEKKWIYYMIRVVAPVAVCVCVRGDEK